MPTLAAYFDDSRNEGIYVIAGYMSHREMWEEDFAPAWRKALADAPHPLSEFKTANCRQGFGEFKDWTRQERDDLKKALVRVIADVCPKQHLVGIANAVVLPAFALHPHERPRADELGMPLGLLTAMSESLQLAAMLFKETNLEEDAMRVVFDNQPGWIGRGGLEFERARRRLDDSLRDKMRPVEFEDSKTSIAIQAADLLAYETYKEVKSRMESPRRAPSKALERLVNGCYHRAQIMDVNLLRQNQRESKAGTPIKELPSVPFLFESGKDLRAPGFWHCEAE